MFLNDGDPGVQPGASILAMGSGAAMPQALNPSGTTAYGLAIPSVQTPEQVNNSTTRMPIFNAPPPPPPAKPAMPAFVIPAALGLAAFFLMRKKKGRGLF